jgi:hypothetical protein
MKNKILILDNNFTLKIKGEQTILPLTDAHFIVEVYDKYSDFMDFSFTVSGNIDMTVVKHLLKGDKIVNMTTGELFKKQDCVTDCELYENINGQSVKVMDMFCAMMTSYSNEYNHLITLRCDWITYNPESQTAQQIVQSRQTQINEYNDKMNQYNKLLKELDIDPNESVFSNNFRKSFNKMDWFRPYKI